LRERWFGATGRRVPQLAAEGEVDLEGALVLEELDAAAIAAAWEEGRPVVVRAQTQDDVLAALARPEVSSVVAPQELVDIDLVGLTYGS
jgi:hypothetical protein